MVTTLLNCRVKCALKYLSFVLLLLVSFYYWHKSADSSSSLKIAYSSSGHKSAESSSLDHKSVSRPNDLFRQDGGYKNSKSLVEKLRPKLVTSNPLDHPDQPVWNDLGVARNQLEVQIREEGYKVFAFNTLVR
jgi:hypothetical protein